MKNTRVQIKRQHPYIDATYIHYADILIAPCRHPASRFDIPYYYKLTSWGGMGGGRLLLLVIENVKSNGAPLALNNPHSYIRN